MFQEFVPKERWRVGIGLDEQGEPKWLPVTRYTELDDLFAYEGILYCDARINGFASVKGTKGKPLKEAIPVIKKECQKNPEVYFPGLYLWCMADTLEDCFSEKKYKIVFGDFFDGWYLRSGCLFRLNEDGTMTGIYDARFKRNPVAEIIHLTNRQIKELHEKIQKNCMIG